MTLPMGRVSTPRRAIASQTRMPARSRKSNGSRVRQFFTSSMPAIRPTCRMSPTFGKSPERFQFLAQTLPFELFRARMDFSALQNFQARQRRRRAELVAGVTVAVKKGFELLVFAKKGVEDFASSASPPSADSRRSILWPDTENPAAHFHGGRRKNFVANSAFRFPLLRPRRSGQIRSSLHPR
jgi:hypothetical protein